MGSFGLNFVKEDIYYGYRKHGNYFLAGKNIQNVSFYLNRDIGRELLDIINISASTTKEYEDKILKVDTLKQEILKELAGIRLKYKELYHRVKNVKSLTDEERASLNELSELKKNFVCSLNFLDGVLRSENDFLKKVIRKNNRNNSIDLTSSFFLDHDSMDICAMMVKGETFFEMDNHVYLCALSHYLKTVDIANMSGDKLDTCISYVDEILSRFKENKAVYLESLEDINLLKQVVRQRLLSISKDDKSSKIFLNIIKKKINDLEVRNISYDTVSKDDDDSQLSSSFYQAIQYEKNINLVELFLRKRPDLIYMESPSNSARYYLADIISEFSNLLLNARENHENFEYYRSLLNLYSDVIFTLDNQDMKLFVLNRFQRIMKNIENSSFDVRRKEACLFAVFECIDRLNGKDTSNLLEFHNANCNSYHKSSDKSVFSIDDDETKLFEQAYSYSEENGNKYLSFYIPDTTELYGFKKVPKLEDLVLVNSEKSKVLSREICDALNLRKSKESNVIGYHFVIGEDYKVKSFDIRKEMVVVSNNFSFSDVELLVDDNSDNYYSDTIRKMYDTLSKIDSSDCVVSKDRTGKYLTTKLSLFFQHALGKYCDDNDIPYISRFVYTKKQVVLRVVRDIEKNFNSDNLTVEQIVKSMEQAYLAGIYTVDKADGVNSDRRAKVTAPLRQLPSYVNQLVICYYFANGDNISYREDLKNRRDLHKIADALNAKLIKDEMKEVSQEEKCLESQIRQTNRKIKYRMMKAK